MGVDLMSDIDRVLLIASSNPAQARRRAWSVMREGEIVVSGLPSNSAAWREAERIDVRPTWKSAAAQLRTEPIDVPLLAEPFAGRQPTATGKAKRHKHRKKKRR
jgi:hypothetical protein